MSVPGLESEMVELRGVTFSEGDPAILQTDSLAIADHQSSRESPHLRFQIEDVEEHPHSGDLQLSITTPGDTTITSFGYNTAEAVPMTVYYRHGAEDAGRKRPSLDYLHEGRIQVLREHREGEPAADLKEGEGVDDESGSTTSRKWWQCWKRGGPKKEKKALKFGWIRGVLIRCLLNIWGVMLFIRLSWIVGQAGIGLASVIILLAAVVTTITTLSMSAICTNGEVKGGGAYYLISRSLGPEFGGAIGLIFSLANAVAVALYAVGFAETVSALFIEYNTEFTGDPVNDIRVIGFALVTLLLVIALIGLDWEAKIQIILLIILIIAIADFFIGTFIPRDPHSEEHLRGFTGYSVSTLKDNLGPSFQPYEGVDNNFFTIFAVFFPAATGILAGANISGDLKNPSTAIPKGTLLAILISTIVYLAFAWMVGSVVIRNAPGDAADFFEGLLHSNPNISNGTTTFVTLNFPNTTSMESCGQGVYNDTSFVSDFPQCGSSLNATLDCIFDKPDYSTSTLIRICEDLAPQLGRTCEFGLLNFFQVMEMVSLFGPIVTAGIFAATISSALASLVSAPKIFQRVCQDKIFPGKAMEKVSEFFAKGSGRTGTEPIRAYILTYAIAVACVAIGELNEIALIISNFFLMAYALINFSCFAASFAKSPGWRPSFKFYSKWVALAGAALCLGIMFIIRWYYALITIVVVAALYMLVNFLKPDINWGSSTQAFLYSYSMRNLLKLEKLESHIKNFRPQFLVLTGPPSSRPDLIQFVSHMSKDIGIMVCGQVVLGDYTKNRRNILMQSEQQKRWLRKEKIKAFHNMVSARTLQEGTQSLLQLSGLGQLRPNTIVIGYKNNWTKCPRQEVEEYVAILHDAFDFQFGVVIFRLRAGFDATEEIDEGREATDAPPPPLDGCSSDRNSPQGTPPMSHGLRMRGAANRNSDAGQPLLGASDNYGRGFTEIPLSSLSGSHLHGASSQLPQGDYQPIGEGDSISIDSYTMAMESGGLALDDESEAPASQAGRDTLQPEIITMPSRFENTQESGNIDVWWLYDDGGLAILLPFLLSRHKLWKNTKLRIFAGGSAKNIDQAKLRMTSLLRKFRIDYSTVIEVTGINNKPAQESIDKYTSLQLGSSDEVDSKNLDKLTLRHIRLGELLHEHSSDARLIVMTISVPQRSRTAHQYMSWLEIMSVDLPPVLLMRGNQSSVLTFYS